MDKHIAIKLLIDRIGGELVIWLKLMAVLNLMKFFTLFQALTSHILQTRQLSFSDHWISKNGNWSKQFGLHESMDHILYW